MGGAGGGEGDLALGGVGVREGDGDLLGVGGELLGVEGVLEALEPVIKQFEPSPSSCFLSFIPAIVSISKFLNKSMTTFAFK